jgi:Rrf2 family protein
MKTLLKISEGSIIAIHSIFHLLGKDSAISAKELARNLDVSYNHLSKVLQKLSKEGFLNTNRGPDGGYYLTEKGKDCTLKDILSAIEGDLNYESCLGDRKICKRKNCELNKFLMSLNFAFDKILRKHLKDL